MEPTIVFFPLKTTKSPWFNVNIPLLVDLLLPHTTIFFSHFIIRLSLFFFPQKFLLFLYSTRAQWCAKGQSGEAQAISLPFTALCQELFNIPVLIIYSEFEVQKYKGLWTERWKCRPMQNKQQQQQHIHVHAHTETHTRTLWGAHFRNTRL